MNPQDTLKILQYNVCKSRDTVMAAMLRDPRIHNYDILAIQEPWRIPFTATTHHPEKDVSHLCYPTERDEKPARVCFFINKKLDHRKWQFKEHSRDVCTLTIEPDEETREEQRLIIHNIYNSMTKSNSERNTLEYVRKILQNRHPNEQILRSDFNLHHPLWGGLTVRTTDPESEDLIAIMEDFDLNNTLMPGTITYEEGPKQSTIDLCLVTMRLVDRVPKSHVDRELDHDSDHLPISTVVDMRVKLLEEVPKREWKRMDAQKFKKALRKALPPLRRPANRTALDTYVQEIVQAIQNAVDGTVPKKHRSDRSRDGWTEECRMVLAEAKRLKRVHKQSHTEESWEEYRLARNKKTV